MQFFKQLKIAVRNAVFILFSFGQNYAIYEYMYVCIHACMYVCMYVWIFIFIN